MAKRDFLVSIDLNKNELLNAKLQNLGVLPLLTTGDTGYFAWYNNTANFWTGSYWKSLEETIATNLNGTYSSTTLDLTPVTGSLSGSTFTVSGATSTYAGLLTGAMYDRLIDSVTKTDYDANTILVADSDNTPFALSAVTNSVIGRIGGGFQAILIDNDLTTVSGSDDTLASAKAIRAYVNAVASPTGHTHYQLYQPNGTNPFIYTDNSGTLHIDGNIVQSGNSYTIHAQDIYTTGNTITLRDGAVAGLGALEYVGFIAKLYDGVNDGQLVFDNTGTARVGDIGSLQPIATRIETPSDGYFAYWENGNTRLNFKQLTISDISNLNTYTGSTNLVTLGTVTTGTWHGQIIESQYGGTGINNGGRTLTVSGNSGTLAFAGAYVLTIAGNGSVSGNNTGDQTITLSGDVVTSAMTNGTYAATLPNITSAGTYNTVVVNAKGQVISGATVGAAINKFNVSITGNSVSTSFVIIHNLSTTNIVTYIKDSVSLAKVEVEEIVTDANTLTVNFNVAPINGKIYNITIMG